MKCRSVRPMPLQPTIWLTALLWIAFLCAAFLPPKAHAQTIGNNGYVVLLKSAVRTATPAIPGQSNPTYRCITAVLNITAAPGVETLTLAINGKDPVSGVAFAILTGAAVSAAALTTYTVCPGNTVAANVSAATFLPNLWNVTVTHSASGSWTYSVTALLSQ